MTTGKIDDLMIGLLIFEGNEACMLDEKCKNDFRKIITEVCRIKYGMRYHQYDRDCPCQPECIIKQILKYNQDLTESLMVLPYGKALDDVLNNPINRDKTVFDEEYYEVV